MPQDFEGKVIAVSGAASGIGLATAQHLYSLGASLSLTDVRQEVLSSAIPSITSFVSAKSAEHASGSGTIEELQMAKKTQAVSADRKAGEVSQSSDGKEDMVYEDDRIVAVAADVRSSNQVNNWIDVTIRKFGQLDGVGRRFLSPT